MTTQIAANALVNYCRLGQMEEELEKLDTEDVISLEPNSAIIKEVRGLPHIIKKGQQFYEMAETFHRSGISDRIVAENFFSRSMKMDITFKEAPRSAIKDLRIQCN